MLNGTYARGHSDPCAHKGITLNGGARGSGRTHKGEPRFCSPLRDALLSGRLLLDSDMKAKRCAQARLSILPSPALLHPQVGLVAKLCVQPPCQGSPTAPQLKGTVVVVSPSTWVTSHRPRGDLVSQHRAQEHQKRQTERCGLRALLSLTGISGQETQEFVGTQEELRVLITYLAP